MSKVSPILPQQDNYEQLLDECKQIITECEFTSRWALVEGYHQLGTRILQEKSVTVTQLAQDLNRSERTIQCAVKFAKKYPDLQLLPEGKNVSWHSIVNKYLPETAEKKPNLIECPYCHKTWEK
jgi:hypothetical protein